MPSLPFVLPHWLYWGTLVVFPIVAIYFVQRQHRRGVPKGPSLFIAYMFWLCSGFMGLHRFYLRNNWGIVFIPVFLSSSTPPTSFATSVKTCRARAPLLAQRSTNSTTQKFRPA